MNSSNSRIWAMLLQIDSRIHFTLSEYLSGESVQLLYLTKSPHESLENFLIEASRIAKRDLGIIVRGLFITIELGDLEGIVALVEQDQLVKCREDIGTVIVPLAIDTPLVLAIQREWWGQLIRATSNANMQILGYHIAEILLGYHLAAAEDNGRLALLYGAPEAIHMLRFGYRSVLGYQRHATTWGDSIRRLSQHFNVSRLQLERYIATGIDISAEEESLWLHPQIIPDTCAEQLRDHISHMLVDIMQLITEESPFVLAGSLGRLRGLDTYLTMHKGINAVHHILGSQVIPRLIQQGLDESIIREDMDTHCCYLENEFVPKLRSSSRIFGRIRRHFRIVQ